ncbi:advillin [Elysia marginata]|uniref:Advillin n=1 Tax=Elysia marginata TaxID=1093978 RepID=A0AAV4J8G9_9GAST|nr:advillin [Elysia marginata]
MKHHIIVIIIVFVIIIAIVIMISMIIITTTTFTTMTTTTIDIIIIIIIIIIILIIIIIIFIIIIFKLIIITNGEQHAMRNHLKKLDLALEGSSFLSIEHEGHETSTFLSHFEDGIVIVEGKRKEPVSRAAKYTKRLYIVEGLKYLRATCCQCVTSNVEDDRVLILDSYPRMYVWMGHRTDYVLRVKAMRLANKMRAWQRNGKGHIVVIDATEKKMSEAFFNKLQDDQRGADDNGIDLGKERPTPESQIRHLYRLNGDRVMYDIPLVAKQPLQQKYLTTMDCYLLDSGPSNPVLAWVGNEADHDALYSALDRAQAFTQYQNYPSTTTICRLTEGDEPHDFKNVFCWWRDKAVKERKLSRNYTVANIGRALYSATDRRTVAKLTEVWSDDHFLSGRGTNHVYRVDGGNLVRLAVEDLGVFFNRSCYIILHRTEAETDGRGGGRILYYWVGSKCTAEEELQAQKFACSMDASLYHTCAVLRVLDGKESRHFFAVLHGSMVVYDSDQHSPHQLDDTPTKPLLVPDVPNMFCIREIGPECMRVEQVPPLTSYLNSSAAYIVISDSLMVWYGKNALANDREYAKNMLTYFCAERARDYSIINEGKETSTFWLKVENNGDYPREFCKQDLNESCIYMLDSHDQLQVWCGSRVWDRDYTVICQLLKVYLDLDPCGRCREDVSIWTISQGFEPHIFIRHFISWDPDGYGGKVAYEAGRKRLRQENARIDIDCQMIDTSCVDATKVSYRNLVKEEDLSTDIDLHHKENHLSDADFARVMHQSRAQFYRLPLWKQAQILRSTRLANTRNTQSLNYKSFCIPGFSL